VIAAAAVAAVVDPSWWIAAFLIFLLWPMQVLLLAWRKLRSGLSLKFSVASASLTVIGKIPQLFGFYEYHSNRLMGRTSQLIEHKRPTGS
jgi:hypothetical protein